MHRVTLLAVWTLGFLTMCFSSAQPIKALALFWRGFREQLGSPYELAQRRACHPDAPGHSDCADTTSAIRFLAPTEARHER